LSEITTLSLSLSRALSEITTLLDIGGLFLGKPFIHLCISLLHSNLKLLNPPVARQGGDVFISWHGTSDFLEVHCRSDMWI
jgi:hypothetical protein